jgi:transmembrane sensor
MEDRNNKKSKSLTDSEKKFEQLLSSMSVPSGKGKEDAWNELLAKINSKDEASPIRRQDSKRESSGVIFYLTKPVSIAASFLMIAALSFSLLWLTGEKTIMVPRGESLAITLPDNTEVFLNAETSISYKRTGWKKNRVVKLQGEAFFNVTKGPGFTVDFPSGSVTVVGTSFNVYQRESGFEILCKSGTILVTSGENDISEKLESGEGIRKEMVNNDKYIERFGFSPDKELAWITGDFHFDNAPLEMVFMEIERQFDVIIHAPDVDLRRRYTGIFRRGNLDAALDMVCIPMSLKYKKAEGKMIIIE